MRERNGVRIQRRLARVVPHQVDRRLRARLVRVRPQPRADVDDDARRRAAEERQEDLRRLDDAVEIGVQDLADGLHGSGRRVLVGVDFPDRSVVDEDIEVALGVFNNLLRCFDRGELGDIK